MIRRTITAVVAFLIFFPFVLIGGLPLKLFMLLLATIGLWELLHMMQIPWSNIEALLAFVMLFFSLFPFGLTNNAPTLKEAPSWLFYVGFLLMITIAVFKGKRFPFPTATVLGLGSVYIGIGFRFLIETRQISISSIVYILFICFANDTFAYFVGKLVGQHKLAPHISPNKTIEGSLGGIVGAVLVSVLLLQFPLFYRSFPGIAGWQVVVMTVGLAIFGQIGDLIESMVKRYYHVKDSGNLLPGHGGILDRFDSMFLVLPMFHYILTLFL